MALSWFGQSVTRYLCLSHKKSFWSLGQCYLGASVLCLLEEWNEHPRIDWYFTLRNFKDNSLGITIQSFDTVQLISTSSYFLPITISYGFCGGTWYDHSRSLSFSNPHMTYTYCRTNYNGTDFYKSFHLKVNNTACKKIFNFKINCNFRVTVLYILKWFTYF
jgi:hypothetical protein